MEACHHGKISPKEASRMLRRANRVGGYISLQTCDKMEKFVVLFLTDKDRQSVCFLVSAGCVADGTV